MATISPDGKKILNNYDRFTGVAFNASKVVIYEDGTSMDDSKVDNSIYLKLKEDLGGGYAKRDYDGAINLLWFGVDPTFIQDSTSGFLKAISYGKAIFIPEGYYKVTTDLDLSKATGTGVVINTTTLRRMVYRNDENLNQLLPVYGSNFYNGIGSAYTQSEVDATINKLKTIPYRPIMLCINFVMDSLGNLRLTYANPENPGHSELKLDKAIQDLLSAGFQIFGIKVHQNHLEYAITDYAKYWTQYRSLIADVRAKFSAYNYIFISNEAPELTGNPAYYAQIESIISDCKMAGWMTGMTLTVPEVDVCLHLSSLDVIGINMYPFVSYGGLNATIYEAIVAWDQDIDVLKRLKETYPTKELMVTEFSSRDKLDSLINPGKWDWPPEATDNNGNIIKIFWEGALIALSQVDIISHIFGWDFQDGFSPYAFPESLKMIKNYLK